LRFVTEFGRIDAEPGEIVVIPRGVKFPAELSGGPARGCTCESCGGAFTVAERGPIDANCPRLPRRFGRHHPARLHAAAWPGSPDLRSRQPFELKPVKLTGTLAAMCETRLPRRMTTAASTSATRQDDYADCSKGLERWFDSNRL
jgi:homogentisate 1,2-dioxygenase